MNDNKQHLKFFLDRFLKDRKDITDEIARLRKGDCDGMVLMTKNADGKILEGAHRISSLLYDRNVNLADIDSRIDEFCQNSGLENPIKKTV